MITITVAWSLTKINKEDSIIKYIHWRRKQNWSGQARCLWSEWVTLLCCALEQLGRTATVAALCRLHDSTRFKPIAITNAIAYASTIFEASPTQRHRKQNWSGQAKCLWSEWVTLVCCALEQFGQTATAASLISLLARQYTLNKYRSRLHARLYTLVLSVTNS